MVEESGKPEVVVICTHTSLLVAEDRNRQEEEVICIHNKEVEEKNRHTQQQVRMANLESPPKWLPKDRP